MIFKEFVKEIRDLNSSTLLNKTVVCIAKDTLLIIGNKYKVHNEMVKIKRMWVVSKYVWLFSNEDPDNYLIRYGL